MAVKSHQELGDRDVVKAPSDCGMDAGLEGVGLVGPGTGHLGKAEGGRDGREEGEPNRSTAGADRRG